MNIQTASDFSIIATTLGVLFTSISLLWLVITNAYFVGFVTIFGAIMFGFGCWCHGWLKRNHSEATE